MLLLACRNCCAMVIVRRWLCSADPLREGFLGCNLDTSVRRDGRCALRIADPGILRLFGGKGRAGRSCEFCFGLLCGAVQLAPAGTDR